MAKRKGSRERGEERRLSRMRRLIVLAVAVVAAAVVALGISMTSGPTELALDEGSNFRIVESPFATTSGPIKVTEFFSYGCSACAQLEPRLADWVVSLPEDVEFEVVPFVGNPTWNIYARGHYAMRDRGLLNSFHSRLFDTIGVRGNALSTNESFATFVSPRSTQAFIGSMNGLRVQRAMQRADELARALGVISVPTLVVDRRYVVLGQAASIEALRLAEMLIERAREDRATVQTIAS